MTCFAHSARLRALALALALSAWIAPAGASQDSSTPSEGAPARIAAELLSRVQLLASDQWEGREAGARGGRAAGDWLAAELVRLGLRGAGDHGGFEQPFGVNYRNILAMIPGSDPRLKDQFVLVCAHYDHVGFGTKENSRGPLGKIHRGADDNASGTALLLEFAQALAAQPRPPARSILLAFWDAEEKEMLGSRYWVKHPTVPLASVCVAINLDMVGRLRNDRLIVYGSRTAAGFRRLVSQDNRLVNLSLDFSWELEDDSDHYAFVSSGVPILYFYTGDHKDSHSPRDTPDRLNIAGMVQVGRLLDRVVGDLASRRDTVAFRRQALSENEKTRRQLENPPVQFPDRLGARWEMPKTSRAVRLSFVADHSPAANAGALPGDQIVRFAGREIHSQDDFTSALLLASSRISLVVYRPQANQDIQLALHLDGEPMRLGISWRSDDAEPGTVVLTSVVPESPAARAGLKAGDRIYHDLPNDVQFARFVKSPRREPFSLVIERDGRFRTAAISSPDEGGKLAGSHVVAPAKTAALSGQNVP